ncbi:MAG: PEP-CTERM-box response regulator transcription factor [Gammaproteobacteria bacterium]|nr:PEP-CTERM-box response regulator transcription factor [Gammaproteobacteria bacterium]
MSEQPLLVVEDDPGIQRQLRWCFDNYRVTIVDNRESALAAIESQHFPVMTLDLGLPPDADGASEGLKALAAVLDVAPHTKVIVVSGNDDRENAMRAVAAGAYDFYCKPIDTDELRLIVDRALQLHRLEADYRKLVSETRTRVLENIITASPAMEAVCRMVERVAPTDVTTLILGESGTGKELVAKAIHGLSERSDRELVAINCAAIPENLLESELFGYEKGAFTGALKRKPGRIEFASGGTLFLDEIGDIPLPLQSKLLRFLQERVIQRLGGNEDIPVDVRVICATHQDLQRKIADGSFREDLYYRISDITIQVPPLRERGGDIALLAKVFLDRYRKQFKRSCDRFSQEAIEVLTCQPWHGNVRELEGAIKRAVVMSDGAQVSPEDLGLLANDEHSLLSLREARDKAEAELLGKAELIFSGNITKMAEALDVSRPTLYSLMEKHGMKGVG